MGAEDKDQEVIVVETGLCKNLSPNVRDKGAKREIYHIERDEKEIRAAVASQEAKKAEGGKADGAGSAPSVYSVSDHFKKAVAKRSSKAGK